MYLARVIIVLHEENRNSILTVKLLKTEVFDELTTYRLPPNTSWLCNHWTTPHTFDGLCL